MKKLFFIINLFMFCMLNMRAQITLEHILDSTYSGNWFYCTDIGDNEHKYVFLDAENNSFSLYNLDMSPYLMNVVIPSTGDSIINGFTVIYITKTLFDCDSNNIEYVFERPSGLKNSFRIYRTDGTALLEVDSANGPYNFGAYGGSHDVRPIMNTSAGTKLFLQKEDANEVGQVLIYNLCGTLPQNFYDLTLEDKNYVRIFPNPVGMELNFEIMLPNNREELDIIIFNTEGRELQRINVLLQERRYSLDVSRYSSGAYYYSLASRTKLYQSGKFILSQ